MYAWKKILMFLIYFGLILGIIVGLAFPVWLIGWILFIGLMCCVFSHLFY
ncbi:MAG: hypothetical protein R3Y09_13310 [Clostridia bacterium]